MSVSPEQIEAARAAFRLVGEARTHTPAQVAGSMLQEAIAAYLEAPGEATRAMVEICWCGLKAAAGARCIAREDAKIPSEKPQPECLHWAPIAKCNGVFTGEHVPACPCYAIANRTAGG